LTVGSIELSEKKNAADASDLTIQDLRCQHIGPLTLSVGKGECVGITGPSGVGKTLFLRAVADMDPHDGQVLLRSLESTGMSGPEWRRRVGYLPSESAWWFESVGEHLNGVDPGWLHDLGFEADVLDWQVSRLSSGERQRLALIRLLAGGPKALLLDEPTANLDADNIRKAEAFLTAYRQRYRPPTLWVSHDADQLSRVSDRQFRLLPDGLHPL
jgi:ABC-type iron transport system FetAB ATPase subunit